jgi:prepilin-type N-terminal cleavage/methylation domain-containing protein
MSRPPRTPLCGEERLRGFTLIELLVVVSIIILAAGLMTPTITDFFRNRQLESIRGSFGSSFNAARLEAVGRGFPFSVIFFQDGTRVFNEKLQVFTEDDGPTKSPFTEGVMWYELGFFSRKPSTELPLFRDWEPGARLAPNPSLRLKAGSYQYRTDDVPKVIFERDGSLRFSKGADVDSRLYKDQKNADIWIFQVLSPVACMMDLRLPGQFKSQIIIMDEVPKRPDSAAKASEPATTESESGGGGE